MTTITHTIYRNDDETQVEIEATGRFYDGALVDIDIVPFGFVLTDKELGQIAELLIQARADEFDENKMDERRRGEC